ncbi:MAG: hypothetical protein J6T26_01185 [Firmicutes bacterium]|nr:hypothetical protein [Bacillota bacterium]
MVKLINAHTGTVMWVHEDRLEEYLARGHQMAPPPRPAPKEPVKRPPKKAAKKPTET